MEAAYQNSNGRIMIRIMRIVRQLLNQCEKIMDEFIVHHSQVVDSKSFHTRHLVHKLQKKAMQTRVLISAAIDQLQESGEASLVHHAREHGLILAPVEEKKRNNSVQRPSLIFLKQAVDNLGANIVFVGLE